VQTSLGPYGRNKIVINHLQKMILTNDAATILRELEVVHPAAKLLVMASQQQEAEMGDATNLVIVLAGELLKKAEDLIRMGLKTSEIAKGYERAQGFALKALEELEVERVEDIRSQAELAKALRTVIAAKQSGNEDFLADKVAEAVLAVMPKNPYNFNVDNVRVVKIMGGGLEQSKVVKGMVFGRETPRSASTAAPSTSRRPRPRALFCSRTRRSFWTSPRARSRRWRPPSRRSTTLESASSSLARLSASSRCTTSTATAFL
jgi:T-complex protein 1 subunit theta